MASGTRARRRGVPGRTPVCGRAAAGRGASTSSPLPWDSRADILDLLVAHGADVNRACDHTRPVLNEPVRWGQFGAARLYVARGASPNLPDDRGWTAVHQVVSRGNLRMLQDLLVAGGDPNRADQDGRTPRGMAKAKGRTDLLKAIDAAGAQLSPRAIFRSAGIQIDQ